MKAKRPKQISGKRRSAAGAAKRRRTARAKAPERRKRAAPGMKLQPLPPFPKPLSVIVTAMNEAETLPKLLRQALRLQPAELIVVLNGCTDRSYELTRRFREAVIVHCPQPAGHDVGRALGAKLSRGEILLFLDGDMELPAEQMAVFVQSIADGADVALNDLDPLVPLFHQTDPVTRCKLYLNQVLGREDLGSASMTAVPHALSRRAAEVIGCRELMVPPKAQAIAVMANLDVRTAGTVDVIKCNRQRAGNRGTGNAMERLIAGDHAEALEVVQVRRREAAGWTPEIALLERRRELAAWRNGL
ncbi:glycosyltransferase [Paenibacillus sp. NFR01]|uniref:glycosyltransferase family 2 protein n=1 Tax=Paenibacillus sp. NFR01 TaxID=1566279 RepID=UPI0008D3D38C|nr:glycosyltransferase [Paenibacillus sp. NFR01]SEU18811.1 Glycosyl transferase family 2 [Paenibacillus sp. NFR01]